MASNSDLGGVQNALNTQSQPINNTENRDLLDELHEQMVVLEEQIYAQEGDVKAAEVKLAALEATLAQHLNGIEPGAGDIMNDGTIEGALAQPATEEVEEIAELTDQENIAENLAAIEPAAGEGAIEATGGNGYGFQSEFEAAPVGALEDVGPIDPTQLRYGVEFRNDEIRPQDDSGTPDGKPLDIDPGTNLIDESDLAPTTNVSGTINADFGPDGAGSISGNGTSDVTGLTSGGQPVTVTYDISTGTYTGIAAGEVIFTLTIQPDGNYEFVLSGTLDHPDPTNPNDIIPLQFGVQAADSDGDTISGVLTINVADDGPIAVNDGTVVLDNTSPHIGNVTDNDDSGADTPATVTSVNFNGTEYAVTDSAPTVIDAEYGTLSINTDGSYTYTPYGTNTSPVSEDFTYTLTDSDGDSDTAILDIYTCDVLDPVLIVGKNVDDVDGSSTPQHIGDESGIIAGTAADDILIGDVGGSDLTQATQDYNFLFVLDVSGSMGNPNDANSKISLLTSAVQNLLGDLTQYQNGEIKIHFTPFNTNSTGGASFTITDANALAEAVEYLESLNTGGFTNYEAAMQNGIDWLLNGDSIAGAETVTYFISDGEPNHYLDDNGNVVNNGSANAHMAQIDGTSDSTNEIALLNNLSDEVISVGIQTNGTTITRLDAIDSDGNAMAIDDPTDLSAALASTNPLLKLTAVGGDHIEGGAGDDIIFGDSVNTDVLADEHGLNTQDGAGWETFDQLESGQSALSAAWDRADTTEYIRSHADELAEESTGSEGEGRTGGDDVLYGGDGDDMIYAQEGNDTIYGGAGNDILSGGTGADTFMIEAINHGIDVIRDFGADEGDVLDLSGVIQNYDPTQQAIDSFIFARDVDGGTVLSVDVSGSGNAANAVDLVALEGMHNLDVQALVESGNIHVM